jgi:hypothetical protein
MSTHNPFSGDAIKGEAFEQGYLAGFANPDLDAFQPLAPDLLQVYNDGVDAGREDRSKPPEGSEENEWAEVGAQVVEHAVVHALAVAVEMIFEKVAGGLISLVATVVQIPGDVMLRPLELDWSGPADEEGNTFVAVCPRADHPMVQEGVTGDGYWAGRGHDDFAGAAADLSTHGHAEAFVALCSLPNGTCGPVWAVK